MWPELFRNRLRYRWRSFALNGFQQFAQRYYRRFKKHLAQPMPCQMRTLGEILDLSTSSVRSYRDFKDLPLQSYGDLHARIEKQRQSGTPMLTQSLPKHYEPTSGSSGARKWIPYTPALFRSFTQMFIYWTADTLTDGPALRGGRLYFSVSPQFQADSLADDADYLTGPTQWFFRHFQAAPSTLKYLSDPADFFHVLCLYLLACPDLEVISIWSPSFLLSVIDYMHSERMQLLQDATNSEITRAGRRFHYGAITQAKRSALAQSPLDLPRLFPHLRLISAWGSHHAQSGLAKLQTHFPGVHVQAKGLLATEAPITFPSEKYGQFVPLIDQVFFEFLDDEGQICLLDQVKVGHAYELIISQKSGLLRYRLGDRVRITGFAAQTPCFDFVGRQSAVSDLVGEKLNDSFVAEQLNQLYPGQYCCLLPDKAQSGYWVLSETSLDSGLLEQALCQNMHYFNARQLRQLQPVNSRVIPDLGQRLKAYFVLQGMALGDIKDSALYPQQYDGRLLQFLFTKNT